MRIESSEVTWSLVKAARSCKVSTVFLFSNMLDV